MSENTKNGSSTSSLYIYHSQTVLVRSGNEKLQLSKEEYVTEKIYNPHENRILDHPNNYLGAFVHLVKSSLGTGILAVPRAFKNAGLVTGTIGNILIGILCTHTVYILVQTSQKVSARAKVPSLGFADTAEEVFKQGPRPIRKWSPFAKLFIEIALVSTYYLGVAVYMVFISVSLTKLLLSLCITFATADAGSKDEQPKQIFNTANTISPQQKPNLLSYQHITHFGDKYQPEHVVFEQRHQPRTQHLEQATPYQHQQESLLRKQNLVPQHQHQPTPVAMVIIAQPAYVPASMLHQGNVAQQLLNFFHGNSQQRYQYIPIRNPQPPQQRYVQAPLQSQHIPQYVHYQPQQDIVQLQPSGPAEQAQSAEFQSHEALPVPQALISHQHIVSHLPQPNAVEARVLQYNAPQHHIQFQQQQLQQIEQQQLQQIEQHQQPQYNEQHVEQQQSDHQKPIQLTEISQIAQQAAQHFLMNGGLQSGSKTAPAIITGLEHFSPEQQEKIKKQLGAHFGSPLQRLNIGGVQEPTAQKNDVPNRTKYYHDQKNRMKTEQFIPSIQVKDGEITQSTSESVKM